MTDELIDEMAGRCRGVNAAGAPCESLPHLVIDGWCPAHRPGGAEAMRARAALGGAATRAKFSGRPFTLEELVPLTTKESAQAAAVQVRDAIMMRRLTHSEGAAAAKAIETWIKAGTEVREQRVVDDLTAKVAEKEGQIADLREQIAALQRLRVAG